MTDRATAIETARDCVASGRFAKDLADLVRHRTESQRADRHDDLLAYLTQEIVPRTEALGFACHLDEMSPGFPVLIATRIEDESLPTVLIYGHGDVVHGQADAWSEGRDPFVVTADGDRLYGRGVADNKGQHLINILALETVLGCRGRLGFNVKLLIEMGEERGSPGLNAFCAAQAERLAADVLIASDGPRLRPQTPVVFTGARGALNFTLTLRLRPLGQHSGNFGGVLVDPVQVLSHALATITDVRGVIQVPGWRATSLTEEVRVVLRRLPEPQSDPDWGDPSLTPQERLFGENSFAIRALHAGDPDAPQNAIPGAAHAACQLRFVVGTDPGQILPDLRAHLDTHGFETVEIAEDEGVFFPATRGPLDDPWLNKVLRSIEATAGAVDLLPNLAGSLPNHVFADTLGLSTIWVSHSYSGCNQHAPDEHVLVPLCQEALGLMAGIFWDIGEPN